MPLPLHLTDSPKISPSALFEQLQKSFAHFEDLLQELHCTPADLRETLRASESSSLLELKTALAALQIKLLAIEYAPHCIGRLVALANNEERPEVARRAASTVLNLAGIPTHTAPQPPAPPPVPPTPPEEEPPLEPDDAADMLHALSFAAKLRKHFGNPVGPTLEARTDVIVEALRPFFPKPAPANPEPCPLNPEP